MISGNSTLNRKDFSLILAGIAFLIFIQVFLHNYLNKEGVIIGITGIVLLAFISIIYIPNLKQFLIYLYILPFLFLNNTVHYSLKWELLFAFPLLVLVLLALLYFLLKENKLMRKNYPISMPLFLFCLYFLGTAVYGYLSGFRTQYVAFEALHVLLFLSYYIFTYLYTKKEDYENTLKFTYYIFIIIGLEYIVLGYIGQGVRFVTFQSSFLPIMVSVLVALMLYEKNKLKNLIYFSLIIVLMLSMFSTLTRSLWVTTLICIASVFFLNRLSKGKTSLLFKSSFIAGIVVLTIFSYSLIKNQIGEISTNQDIGNVEYRVESIANPGEDHSFMMRVEFAFYVYQKYMEKPVFGWGLGDYITYQFLGKSKLENMYPDSIWFYYLWKGGIIGFILAVWLFVRVFKSGLYILRHTDDLRTKIYVLGLLSGFIGMLFLGILSPALIKYRSNVLFAMIFAYFDYHYSIIKNSLVQEDKIAISE